MSWRCKECGNTNIVLKAVAEAWVTFELDNGNVDTKKAKIDNVIEWYPSRYVCTHCGAESLIQGKITDIAE